MARCLTSRHHKGEKGVPPRHHAKEPAVPLPAWRSATPAAGCSWADGAYDPLCFFSGEAPLCLVLKGNQRETNHLHRLILRHPFCEASGCDICVKKRPQLGDCYSARAARTGQASNKLVAWLGSAWFLCYGMLMLEHQKLLTIPPASLDPDLLSGSQSLSPGHFPDSYATISAARCA